MQTIYHYHVQKKIVIAQGNCRQSKPLEQIGYVIMIFVWISAYLALRQNVKVKKTKVIALITLVAVLTNLVLNYFLIKEFGTLGAAYSTLISYAVIAAITFIIANKTFPMPWLAYREIIQFNYSDKR